MSQISSLVVILRRKVSSMSSSVPRLRGNVFSGSSSVVTLYYAVRCQQVLDVPSLCMTL